MSNSINNVIQFIASAGEVNSVPVRAAVIAISEGARIEACRILRDMDGQSENLSYSHSHLRLNSANGSFIKVLGDTAHAKGLKLTHIVFCFHPDCPPDGEDVVWANLQGADAIFFCVHP